MTCQSVDVHPHNMACRSGDIPVVGPLPVQQAVVELADILQIKLHQKKPEIYSCLLDEIFKVKVKSIGVNTGSDQAWFSARIKVSNLDLLDLDLERVLMLHAPRLTKIIWEMQQKFPGEFFWTEITDVQRGIKTQILYSLDTTKENFTTRKEEHKLKTSSKSQTAGKVSQKQEISCCWKMTQSKQHMVCECENICSYLHHLKILSPLADVQFYLNIWGVISSSKFDWHSQKYRLGNRKVAVDIEHYLPKEDIPEGIVKILPRAGLGYNMFGIKVGLNEESGKLTVISAIVPPPLDSELNTRELNMKCQQLDILFYGPGNVPLFVSPKQPSICVTTIVKLDEYGLRLDTDNQEIETDHQMVPFDLSYCLKPMNEEWRDHLLDWREDGASDHEDGDWHKIVLIVIIDKIKSDAKLDLQDDLSYLDSLRRNFVQILCKNRTKVRKAVGSALNKLLVNMTKDDQMYRILQQAIQNISTSCYDVMKHANNEEFQHKCFSRFNLTNLEDLKTTLSNNLWQIASDKYGINASGSHGADQRPVDKTQNKPSTSAKRTLTSKSADKKKKPDGFDELEDMEGLASQHFTPSMTHASFYPSTSNDTVAELIKMTQPTKNPIRNLTHAPSALSEYPVAGTEHHLSPFSDLINVNSQGGAENSPGEAMVHEMHQTQLDAGDQQLYQFLEALNATADETLIQSTNLDALNVDVPVLKLNNPQASSKTTPNDAEPDCANWSDVHVSKDKHVDKLNYELGAHELVQSKHASTFSTLALGDISNRIHGDHETSQPWTTKWDTDPLLPQIPENRKEHSPEDWLHQFSNWEDI